MEDVTFAYESGEPVILRSDFVAAPGQITALVGPSGEGKTTVLRLLLGIVSPQEGQSVFLAPDGQSLDVCSDSRCLITYVPQGNSLLSGTIAENMRLGKADATDEEIIAALELACAWDFISKLPDGINSSVRERGKGLSEGQAQRVAIARALLRDAPIVLMDEATSALDVDTERKLLRNIMQKRPERTIVITTHRPTVLGMCDRIYRVVDSRVVALGAAEIEKLIQDF
jgi:ABC-type multidrug transport system fused ATPase/permease subunit